MADYLAQPTPGDVRLHPEAAPRWLRPVLEGITTGAVHGDLGDSARPRPNTYGKEAAVLMLLSGVADAPAGGPAPDAQLLLTHRTPTLRSHSGQIAFPGGKLDPEDAGPVAAALREATEETGLDPAAVTPLAHLDVVHVRSNGYPVHPILAHWPHPVPLSTASPAETDEVFQVPLRDLINPNNRFAIGWRGWSGPAFWARGYCVWGFTGGLISSLIRGAGWEEEWDRSTVIDLNTALRQSRNQEKGYS